MLPIEALKARVANSELGQQLNKSCLIDKDIWSLVDLGYIEEELKINARRKIYFEKISLSWLKLLAKLTAIASAREKVAVETIGRRINTLVHLDKFLTSKGYYQPEIITETLLEEFISLKGKNPGTKRRAINYLSKLCLQEGWLKLPYMIPDKISRTIPKKINIIPEEVLHTIYENFDLFPSPLERLFRLQLALGCRISELLKMPRFCLKKEGNKWFLKRWIAKRKHWRFIEIHPLVVELIQEQQKFLDIKFGNKSNFDKLFCKLSTSSKDTKIQNKRFMATPIYYPEVLSSRVIPLWLKDFSKEVNLKDKNGIRFELKSHMFRRTKATIMAYCEVEDEYIAAVLGHASLDMLPHYRQRSLERLEKEARTKGYVDMYGRITGFKPRKCRYKEDEYEKLAEIMQLKVTTQLGECHKPTMLGDCQHRYACLSCGHHRVTEDDRPKIIAQITNLTKDLELSQKKGKARRVEEISSLLKLLKNRLEGLEKLRTIQKNND